MSATAPTLAAASPPGLVLPFGPAGGGGLSARALGHRAGKARAGAV